MSSIQRRLFATATLILLFSGLLTSFSSAALAQGKEEAPGQIKKQERLEAESEDTESEELLDEEAESSDEDESSSTEALRDTDESDEDVDDDPVEFQGDISDCPNKHAAPDIEEKNKGANRHGPYDSTCDEDVPAMNGGKVHKNHCAGCVGNADNKNPPGQYPGDHNNGYECDGNNGVGKGNPAHSGCVTVPSVPPPPPNPPSKPRDRDRDRDSDRNPSRPDFNRPRSIPDVNQPPVALPGNPPQQPDVVLGRPPAANPAPPVGQPGVLPVTGPRDASIFMFIGVLLIGVGALAVSADSMIARVKQRR
ncbi:MAG TPA: hypothetical protein VE174_13125 [Actinomycetota bacterium]|nr:hypothetical protein [Actinomycetota bacterium]